LRHWKKGDHGETTRLKRGGCLRRKGIPSIETWRYDTFAVKNNDGSNYCEG